jgi:hypothetical protein
MEVNEKIESIVDNLQSLATSITAIAIGAKVIWPYFTDSSFVVIGSDFITSTDASLVAMAPLVADNETLKSEWEEYSVQHQEWITTGWVWQQNQHRNDRFLQQEEIPSEIYRRDNEGNPIPDDGPGPYGPFWQMSPIPDNASPTINFNVLSNDIIDRMTNTIAVEQVSPVLSEPMDTSRVFGSAASSSKSPTSVMIQSIFDSFDDGINQASPKMVSLLIAELIWDVFFDLAMHPEMPAVDIVVNNTCGVESFTYQLWGKNVIFKGYGDHHETSFDAYRVVYPMAPFLTTDGGSEDCQYLLNMYPTTEFQNQYNNNQAAIATAIVVSVFIAGALIFCAYDLGKLTLSKT